MAAHEFTPAPVALAGDFRQKLRQDADGPTDSATVIGSNDVPYLSGGLLAARLGQTPQYTEFKFTENDADNDAGVAITKAGPASDTFTLNCGFVPKMVVLSIGSGDIMYIVPAELPAGIKLDVGAGTTVSAGGTPVTISAADKTVLIKNATLESGAVHYLQVWGV